MASFQDFLKNHLWHISSIQQVNHKSFLAFEIEHWINFLQMDWTVKMEWAVCTLY